MEARYAWFEGQPDPDPERIVVVDETAAAATMARRYGWAPRGERCRIGGPRGHRCVPLAPWDEAGRRLVSFRTARQAARTC